MCIFHLKENYLSFVINYDLKDFKRDRAKPYAIGFHPVQSSMGNFHRGFKNEDTGTCRRNGIVMEDDDCITRRCESL